MAMALLLLACTGETKPVIKLSGETMGTFWQVSLAHDMDSAAQQELHRRIEATLEAVNAAMSTYREDSELMHFNRSRDLAPEPLSAELHLVIKKALAISKETEGAYDITVGPLVNLWGFGPERRQGKPDEEAIAQALALVGYEKLQLDEKGLRKAVAGMFVDLSSIAKGYGVDAVTETVTNAGYAHFLVDIGGEVRAQGMKYGQAWRVGIERPQQGSMGHVENIIMMSEALPAMATSGNYRNYIDHGGEMAYHIIDPQTGKSRSSTLLSATVLAKDCMSADAYATALMVLGDEKALAFAETQGLAAELIFAGKGEGKFIIKRSAAFTAAVKEAK